MRLRYITSIFATNQGRDIFSLPGDALVERVFRCRLGYTRKIVFIGRGPDMKSKLKTLFVIAAASLCTPILAEPGKNPNNGQGLGIGQDPKLLQMTRDANAGAGNGGEFIRVKGSFSVIGCSAHNMSGCFSTKYVEIDPGNSGAHNQSPECDVIGCVFDPHQ